MYRSVSAILKISESTPILCALVLFRNMKLLNKPVCCIFFADFLSVESLSVERKLRDQNKKQNPFLTAA